MVNITDDVDRLRIRSLAEKLLRTDPLDLEKFNDIAALLAVEIEVADESEKPAHGEFEFFIAVDENGMTGKGYDREAAREDLLSDTRGDCIDIYCFTGRVPSAQVRAVEMGDVKLEPNDVTKIEVTATAA